ncbi:efflux RND transporter periplasmic adaptor subunit [Achromobacter aloeverae]
MIRYDKRLVGGVAGAILIAGASGLGGYGIARYTAVQPTSATQKPGSEKPQESAPLDSVTMNVEAIREAGIMTETVRAGGLGSEIVAQAIVAPQPGGEALVTARAGGAVTRIFKRLGDQVQAGEPLAIVASRDAAQLAAARTAALAQAELARKDLARERYLYEQKVSARVDLERAQAAAQAAAAEARRAQVEAEVANVTKDGQGVTVASPISGQVTSQSANLGAFIQPETELFRVADPKQVQIEAAVLPSDVVRIAPGDRAIVELPAGGTIDAQVRSVTSGLNNKTRQATAVLEVAGGSLHPGQTLRVRMHPQSGQDANAIVVPEEAVQKVDGKDAVFVRTEKGFQARPVTVAQRSAGRVEVLKGLSPGETIASGQAFLLKAELGKGAGEEE